MPPVCWSISGSQVLNEWVYKFDTIENNVLVDFDYAFTYILIPHNMIILYFYLPYFHVSDSATQQQGESAVGYISLLIDIEIEGISLFKIVN